MTSMVERVARAIAADLGYTWGSSGLHHDEMRLAARAAIAAMREPSDSVLLAGQKPPDRAPPEIIGPGTFVYIPAGSMLMRWQAMVDAALEEK